MKAARRAETVITSGPRKDSASKGRIENMVGMVEGLLRTIILSVQHHYGVTFDPTHPILGWAVRHTGWILTRYAMKDNGMTPYRLLRGKDYRGIVVEFAECVLFKLAGAQPKLAKRWEKGIWLGKRNSTDEHILGTEIGTTVARTIQRRPEEHRWSQDTFRNLSATPSSPKGDMHPSMGPRARYITRAIMDRLGRTERCQACAGVGKHHSEECRFRFDKLLQTEEDAAAAATATAAVGEEPAVPRTSDTATPAKTDPPAMIEVRAPAAATFGKEEQADQPMLQALPTSADELMMEPTTVMMDQALGGGAKRAKTIGGLAVNIASRAIMVMAATCAAMPAGPVYGTISGELLDPNMVAAGRKRERELMDKFHVFDRVRSEDAKGKRVRSKWVEDYKDGEHGRIVRSRLVAMEIAWDARADTFAGTPPLKAVRLVLALAVSLGLDYLICLYDVSVAFYHATLDELLHIIPPRGEEEDGYVWQLRRALYGTRRASFLFQQYVMDTMQEAGFVRPGVACQVFWHAERRIFVVVHGDDFLAAARPQDAEWLDETLDKKLMIKRGPRIGSPKHGGVDSGHFLKRKIGWTAEGFTWQHDPVHVKTLIEACLGDKKPTSRDISPSSKSVGKAVRDAADFVSFDETKEYQRLAATALYLAGDRLEIQNAVTILLRGMANPTKLHWLQLCRLASYLAAHPELELVYAYQELPSEVYAEVDADWAGCVETRRSTDGGFEFFGKCLIDGWSNTQQSIALSSGESELYGICNGSARILWTAHLLKEMGFHMKAVVATDSSAAKGVSSRLGAGRIRHLETRCLWIQERVRAKELEIRKVWTDKNRADMQTKPLDPTRFWMLLGLLPLRRATGCDNARGGGLVTAILVSSIGGAQATGTDGSLMDGLGWFLASIFY